MSKLHDILDRVIAKEASTEELIAAIKSGVNVDEKKDYYTPLQRVVSNKMGSEIVQALIDAGADVNAYATKDDLTDEDLEAIEEGECEEYEAYAGAEYAALFEASAENQLDIMKLLIDAGADVNLICGNSDDDTYPALSRAQTKEAIELLIQNGAEVNMVYGDGEGTYTVLGDKVENSNISPECVLTLLKAGAASVAQTPYPALIDSYLQMHSDADEKLLAQIRTLWEKNNVEKQEELEEEFERNRRRNMENDWDDDDGWGDDEEE